MTTKYTEDHEYIEFDGKTGIAVAVSGLQAFVHDDILFMQLNCARF